MHDSHQDSQFLRSALKFSAILKVLHEKNLHTTNSLWECHTTFNLSYLQPGLVECKDYCFDHPVYKANQMNNLDERTVSFYQQFEILYFLQEIAR